MSVIGEARVETGSTFYQNKRTPRIEVFPARITAKRVTLLNVCTFDRATGKRLDRYRHNSAYYRHLLAYCVDGVWHEINQESRA